MRAGARPLWRVALALLAASGAAALPAQAMAEETKTQTPVVTKEVLDGGAWSDEATACAGETVTYRICGTLPSDWGDHEAYAYEFHDQPDAAVCVDASSVEVSLVRDDETIEDLTGLFSATLGDDGLVVATDDLTAATTTMAAGDLIVCTYRAVVDEEACEGEVLENFAFLRYTVSGLSELGQSVEACAQVSVEEEEEEGGGRVETGSEEAGSQASSVWAQTGDDAPALAAAIAAIAALVAAFAARRAAAEDAGARGPVGVRGARGLGVASAQRGPQRLRARTGRRGGGRRDG